MTDTVDETKAAFEKPRQAGSPGQGRVARLIQHPHRRSVRPRQLVGERIDPLNRAVPLLDRPYALATISTGRRVTSKLGFDTKRRKVASAASASALSEQDKALVRPLVCRVTCSFVPQ